MVHLPHVSISLTEQHDTQTATTTTSKIKSKKIGKIFIKFLWCSHFFFCNTMNFVASVLFLKPIFNNYKHTIEHCSYAIRRSWLDGWLFGWTVGRIDGFMLLLVFVVGCHSSYWLSIALSVFFAILADEANDAEYGSCS